MLAYLGTLSGLKGRELDAQIRSALRDVNLAERSDTRVRALSGGMVRRLGIAQTLLDEPRLLLYDEPTTGLDPEERARFRSLLLSFREDRCTLLSTHLVEDVRELCDRVIVLDRGKVRFDGTPHGLAELARGHIVLGDVAETPGMSAVLAGTAIVSGTPTRRWVCETLMPGPPHEPTLEDGYLLVTNGFGEYGR